MDIVFLRHLLFPSHLYIIKSLRLSIVSVIPKNSNIGREKIFRCSLHTNDMELKDELSSLESS